MHFFVALHNAPSRCDPWIFQDYYRHALTIDQCVTIIILKNAGACSDDSARVCVNRTQNVANAKQKRPGENEGINEEVQSCHQSPATWAQLPMYQKHREFCGHALLQNARSFLLIAVKLQTFNAVCKVCFFVPLSRRRRGPQRRLFLLNLIFFIPLPQHSTERLFLMK